MEDFDVKPPFDGQPGVPGFGGPGTPNGEPPAQQQLSLSYPLPPMRYVNKYSENNLRNRTAPPPPKPFVNGKYVQIFNQKITMDDTIIRSLESQGLRRLYPRECDHKRELKKINSSILVNFLDLVDVLIRCPETPKRGEKCMDLELLFFTMHHLINELRPHQARESIRVCLKMQKKQRQETTQRLLKQIERVQEIIRTAIKNIKDKDISALLQETRPENFESPETATENGGGDMEDGIATKMNGDELNGSGLAAQSRMSQLDAFMCDLVDETF